MKDRWQPLLLSSWLGVCSVHGFVNPSSLSLSGTQTTAVRTPITTIPVGSSSKHPSNNNNGGVVWKTKEEEEEVCYGRLESSLRMADTNNNNEVEESPFFSKEVPYGEESRKYRRTVYNADLWLLHRAPERFFHNLIAELFTSGIVRQLLNEVSAVTAIATVSCIWNVLTVDGVTGLGGTHYDPMLMPFGKLILPSIPFSLSTSALGLLLGTHTPSYYYTLYYITLH